MPVSRAEIEVFLQGWPATLEEAAEIQRRLRHTVQREDGFDTLRTVAGLDLGFVEEGRVARAAAVVLSYPGLEPIEQAISYRPVQFPYVPGFLSFREVPAALEALISLRTWPDLLICDGQGIAHPRRFGLACHLGVLAQTPSIGCAKSLLLGKLPAKLGQERGDHQPLLHQDEVIGVALRTRSGTKPVYVSIGHRVSLRTAIEIVLACAPRYRLPETTRLAHKLASQR